jgi:hypothetical protein
MNDILPPDMLQGATLRGNEYGWSVSSFPDALAKAEAYGYACLGGLFASCLLRSAHPPQREGVLLVTKRRQVSRDDRCHRAFAGSSLGR